jgi:hypothetical protein
MAVNGIGRPIEDLYAKYVKGREELILAYYRNGADDRMVAKNLGMGRSTLYRLKRECPDFKTLTMVGKEEADLKVESALFKRALGYEFEEVTTEVTLNKDGSGTTTVMKKTKKHIVPDTTAQIFWLKNRKGKDWKDKQEVEVTNPFLELMKAAGGDDGSDE